MRFVTITESLRQCHSGNAAAPFSWFVIASSHRGNHTGYHTLSKHLVDYLIGKEDVHSSSPLGLEVDRKKNTGENSNAIF